VTVTALAFFPGLAIGSFLNVIAARVPLRRSIVRPASACGSCQRPIAPYDNVPVISYFVLRGRCRACRAPISWKYPLVELVTGLLVAASVFAFGFTLRAGVAVVFCATLVAISVTDLEHRLIPNRIVLPATAVILAAQAAAEPSAEWALAAVGAAGFLLVAALAYPGGMGMGDVKLALLLGAALGRTVTVAMMIAMVSALVPSVGLLVRHGSAGRKMGIPFGPFLALGGVIALFAGGAIARAYISVY
jgi:leader peptidase (prepilin peptidase) / N-methyltransferase